jgi:hypothetical protein
MTTRNVALITTAATLVAIVAIGRSRECGGQRHPHQRHRSPRR